MITLQVKVHIEESSFNRPNPFVPEDGPTSTLDGHFDLSHNYFLHLHTSGLLTSTWRTWEDEYLRKYDGIYGDAARIALFGSPDLIFKPGEKVFEMKPKVKLFQFEPVVQENAVIEDVDGEEIKLNL